MFGRLGSRRRALDRNPTPVQPGWEIVRLALILSVRDPEAISADTDPEIVPELRRRIPELREWLRRYERYLWLDHGKDFPG